MLDKKFNKIHHAPESWFVGVRSKYDYPLRLTKADGTPIEGDYQDDQVTFLDYGKKPETPSLFVYQRTQRLGKEKAILTD
jgi:hypothetical protein